MAVTIRELLGDVRAHLDDTTTSPVADADSALAAVAGLAPIGRALDRLYLYRPHDLDENEPPQVALLTHACLDAARCWPDAGGRVADLLGATADTIGRHAHTFTHEQRWGLAEALAETARRCTDAAQRFEPYATIPQVTTARAAAAACERRAALLSAAAADRTVLDHLVPGRLATAGTADNRIVDAAAALHLAITSAGYCPRLNMAEMVITLNAGQLTTAHAAAAVQRQATLRAAANTDPRTTPAEDPTLGRLGLAAPDAWRAARTHCASFDDGTKLRPPDDSPIASAAARLGRALLDQLGTTPTPASPTTIDDPQALQTLQTVTGLLPDVASRLSRATRPWVADRQLWAPERRLLSYEDRNHAVTSTDRPAVVEYFDLEPLTGALRLAAALTTALASELAQYSPHPARQPHLTEAHTAATDTARYLSIQAQSAHDAVRRAHAMNTQEWALPTGPRPSQTPRR